MTAYACRRALDSHHQPAVFPQVVRKLLCVRRLVLKHEAAPQLGGGVGRTPVQLQRALDAEPAGVTRSHRARSTRDNCAGPPRWLSDISIFHRKSILYGAFVWAHRHLTAENGGFWPGKCQWACGRCWVMPGVVRVDDPHCARRMALQLCQVRPARL